MKHKTWHSKDDLCSNLSVVLCCPVCTDRQTCIAFPIQLFSLFEFGIIRPLLYSSSRSDNFFLTCEKPNERYPNYLQAWWLAPCSRPADPTLFAYIPAAGGTRTSSTSCAHALQDTGRYPGSRHNLYFTALGHLTLMITTRWKTAWYFQFVIKTVIPPYPPSPFTVSSIYSIYIIFPLNVITYLFSLLTFRTWHIRFILLEEKVKRAEKPYNMGFKTSVPAIPWKHYRNTITQNAIDKEL